ncbi:MAG: ComF family protein [Lysobacter sp.]|nr:ComF family protein [Lysobacter sp.]
MLDDPGRPLAAGSDESWNPVATRDSDERWRRLTASVSDDPLRTLTAPAPGQALRPHASPPSADSPRIAAPARDTCPTSTVLIAVPLSRARLRQRGYDQARELARPLARALGLPLLDDALRRLRDTAPQSSLDGLARRRNLRGAFAAAFPAAPPARVLLIDDVMTTGATLHAAATALRRAGVPRVEAWVCARVP